MTIYWITLGTFAFCVCVIALVINIIGFKENLKSNNSFAGWNMVFMVALSACIIYNLTQTIMNIIKLITD